MDLALLRFAFNLILSVTAICSPILQSRELERQVICGKERNQIGLHCEGSVFRSLFGMLMWDIIFSNVLGVFQTPFQG